MLKMQSAYSGQRRYLPLLWQGGISQMNKRQRIARARKAGKASAGIARGESSRINGRKSVAGGRPSNQQIAEYMAEHQCSRSTAYRRVKSA